MDGEGLLAIFGAVMCLIAFPVSLADKDTTKLEKVILSIGIVFFSFYAWTHTTEEFRYELDLIIRWFN